MKPTAILSWIVILVVALGLPIARVVGEHTSTTRPTVSTDKVDMQFELMAKYLYGVSQVDPNSKSTVTKQLDAAAKKSIQQIATATVLAEVEGKAAAIERLESIGTPDAMALRDWYQSQEAIPTDTVDRLGWFGKLATTFEQPTTLPAREAVVHDARVALGGIIVLGLIIITGGTLGFGLMITAIVLLSLGKIRFKMQPPQAPSHIYVESFAIYLATFLVGSILISLFVETESMVIHVSPLLVGIFIAVAWPMLRGVSFRTQRADWGVHFGTNVFSEIAFGIMGYLAGLPLVGLMLAVSAMLMQLSGTTISHPISNEIADNPLTMLLLAAVFAPLTEELLFRGGFVSHLRAWTGVVLSSAISGFIFAAIHPQGWAAIPVLMGMGAVFALIRQWRDSLVPSIAAHALNNGILVTFMILMSSTA